MSEFGKTLKEWNAKKGDVFYFHGGSSKGPNRVFHSFNPDGSATHALDIYGNSMVDSPCWHLVERGKEMTNYNDGKWHGWNGGECTVHPDTIIKAVFTDNGFCGREDFAKNFDFDDKYFHPIIAFKVVKEYKKPREFWCREVDGKIYVAIEGDVGAFKVKEVV